MRFLLVIFAIGFLVTLACAGSQRTRIRPGKKDETSDPPNDSTTQEGFQWMLPLQLTRYLEMTLEQSFQDQEEKGLSQNMLICKDLYDQGGKGDRLMTEYSTDDENHKANHRPSWKNS
ncbi:hypothetical protein P5673_007181 [Acropora cervicornis]|uniref:Uncharacterized protein n=1 Tax=Acropora cervicornis TaxID=6130 RepID=A0AAD9VBF4_ACRCE|nr:hypothetical protein P5673_007181 [Acropora cervicornis]